MHWIAFVMGALATTLWASIDSGNSILWVASVALAGTLGYIIGKVER